MKKVILALIIVINLNAGWVSGNTLVEWNIEYKKDKNQNPYGVGAYQYYILGILDSIDGILICTPNNVNGRQIFAIVGKYINNHPEEWNGSAFNLVYRPLSKAFPCKKKK